MASSSDPVYSTTADYARYQKSNCGCDGKCTCNDNECGCCPPGLVSIEDNNGNNIGCFTANDAQLYMANTFKCADNLIKAVDPTSGVFVGCLTAADFAAYLLALKP